MPRYSTCILELRMAARLIGVDEDAAVQAAETLAADLGTHLATAAEGLTDRFLAGLGLADAIASLPLERPDPGASALPDQAD